jgi:phage terminase large subunit-like protein
MTGAEPGWKFIAGIDLSLTRDSTAVVVLAVPEGGRDGRIRLAQHRLWRPTLGKKINLTEVEEYILALDAKYDLEFCGIDPWNAAHLAQRLEHLTEHRRRTSAIYRPMRPRGQQAWMREVVPTAANLRQQATLTIESFQDRRLQLYPCEALKRDLHKLRVEEKSYGIRLVSPRDGEGHGDTFSAFANALLLAHEFAGKKKVTAGAGSTGARTPAQRTAAQLAFELAEFERLAHTPEDHQAGWREALIRAGGARRLGG